MSLLPLPQAVRIFCSILFLLTICTVSMTTETPAARATPPAPPIVRFDTIKTNLADYIWPTDASRKLTSSFAEYRSTHFHGGIDISTNGHTGYKVLAARDGYVYRVQISPTGYGKMLFIKHSDGYVTVYAHLQTFNDAINRAVHDEQYRKGTYAIDLQFSSPQITVKRGDVVAYSGDTGFGPPHLHFELRDENLNPVNPMLCDNFAVKDDIPPTIRRVMLTPLTPNSTVDNSYTPRFFSRFPRKRNTVKIPQMLHIQGQVGIAVDAIDRTDDTWSKAGVHQLERYLDDSLTFAASLDRVPAEETKMIDLHYDFPTIRHGKGKFQKLYLDIGNSLPFYGNRPEGSGIINSDRLPEGEHNFTLVCKDIAGNQATLLGRLLVNHKPTISLSSIGENDITLSGTYLDAISKLTVFGKTVGGQGWSQHTLDAGRFTRRADTLVLPLDTKRYELLKIVAETSHGVQSAPIYHFVKKPSSTNHQIDVRDEVYNDFVRISVTTKGVFTAVPHCVVEEGSSTRDLMMEAEDESRYTATFVPSPDFAGRRVVRVRGEVDGVMGSGTDSFELLSVPTSRNGSISYDGGNLIISFDSAAVFRPLHMRIEKDQSFRHPFYTLDPDDVLLNRGITVLLPFTRAQFNQRYGLYFRSTAGWVLQKMRFDTVRNVISTLLTRTLGDIALFQDIQPPSIGRVRIFPHGGRPNVGFSFHDNLSGVDPDEIKMYIDDKLVIPDIDGEHHRVWYQADQRLNRGRHSLQISVKDRMKNETHFSRFFTVK